MHIFEDSSLTIFCELWFEKFLNHLIITCKFNYTNSISSYKIYI